jgi:hypothetical protein
MVILRTNWMLKWTSRYAGPLLFAYLIYYSVYAYNYNYFIFIYYSIYAYNYNHFIFLAFESKGRK